MYCEKWGLGVNMEKTKLMVFRNGGIVKRYRSLCITEELKSIVYHITNIFE